MGKITSLFIVPFLMTGVVTTVLANPNNGHNHNGIYDNQRSNMLMTHIPLDHGMFNGLNLSREQREQIRDIMSSQHLNAAGFDHNVLSKLHELIISNNFDEDAVRQQIELNEKQRIDFSVQEVRLRHQVYQILSPEQKQIFNQHFERFLQKAPNISPSTQP